MLSSYVLASVAVAASAIASSAPDVADALQSILNKAHAGIFNYPTSLTQGIIPKGIHSHNDYWRDVPFYSALSVGAVSVESDVWLYNGTLYVGHEQSALTTSRTFESLYINPMLDTLQRQNPTNSQFVSGSTQHGVFDTDSSQTLYLFVDVKTNGPTTWPYVVKALEPLRAGGWLSSVSNNQFTERSITVIGTGNTPLQQIQPVTSRDYFFDGPLADLSTAFSNITSLVSPIASTDFANFGPVLGTSLNTSQLTVLRSQLATAHSKGIKARYWDQPGWPISTRNGIWRQLISEGADLINADDLLATAGFSDSSNYW